MEKHNNRTTKRRLLVAILGMVLMCLVLASCAGCDGCVQGCAKMQEWYRPEMVSGSGVNSVPQITHSPSAEEVSAQLAEYYAPVVDLVDSANRGRDMFSLKHELEFRDGCYYLQSRIVCRPEGVIELPEIYIPYFGEAIMPENGLPEGFGDDRVTAIWLQMTANGLDYDTERLDEELSIAGLLELYVDYYEQVSGLEVDTSRFAEDSEHDDLLRRSMVLKLIELPGYYGNEHADSYDLITAGTALLSAMYYDACGCGTKGFTETELIECVKMVLSANFYPEEEWGSSCRLLTQLCDERLGECAYDVEPMSRQEVAQAFIELYEMMYGKVTVEDHYLNWLEDTEDEYCVKASWLNIMEDFPSSWLFEPGYIPGRQELPGFVGDFIIACRSACLDDGVENVFVTYRDAMEVLSAVDILVRTAGLCDDEPVVVINSRDYDWYYTQHGTGRYSNLNCMPTIAMMATKWYDEATTVTIEEMRGRYLPDYTGGWYTWQVAECLEHNGVPYELLDLSEDKLALLDDGKIILSQMTEAAIDASGHCFIIYGYWKRGDSVKYYVHDPDVYNGTDDYGRRPGYAMILDGRYCDWIIDRIAFSIIAAGE